MLFGRVPRTDRVVIVATGPSLSQIDPAVFDQCGATIIAVNGAVSRVNGAHCFFTCDPSVKVRSLLRSQRPCVRYFAAVPDDFGTRNAAAAVHRPPPESNVTYLRRLTGNGPWKHKPGLSEDRGAIHTGNSAYGALGLAYLMNARRVALFGVDGHGGYAWGLGGAPNDLSHLDLIFRSALPQLKARSVEVVNASPESAVECFPKVTPRDALAWIG